MRDGGCTRASREAPTDPRQGSARCSRAVHRPLRSGAGGGGGPPSRATRDSGIREGGGCETFGRASGCEARQGRGHGQRGSLRAARHGESRLRRLSGVSRGRGVPAARRLPGWRAHARRRHKDDGGCGLAWTRRRRVPRGPEMAHRRRRAGAAAHGVEHRRGRAGNVQGSLLSRARSTPFPRGHARRGVGGRRRRDLRVSAR